MLHVADKLEAIGPRLPFPHSSAVRGQSATSLRELRPRAGTSRWRPIYRQVDPQTFVILAVAPEAKINQSGFDAAVKKAVERLGDIDAP